MKKTKFLVLLLAFAVSVVPAAASDPQKGGTLTVCQPAEPPGLDPTANTAAAIDRVVYANIIEGPSCAGIGHGLVGLAGRAYL